MGGGKLGNYLHAFLPSSSSPVGCPGERERPKTALLSFEHSYSNVLLPPRKNHPLLLILRKGGRQGWKLKSGRDSTTTFGLNVFTKIGGGFLHNIYSVSKRIWVLILEASWRIPPAGDWREKHRWRRRDDFRERKGGLLLSPVRPLKKIFPYHHKHPNLMRSLPHFLPRRLAICGIHMEKEKKP